MNIMNNSCIISTIAIVIAINNIISIVIIRIALIIITIINIIIITIIIDICNIMIACSRPAWNRGRCGGIYIYI